MAELLMALAGLPVMFLVLYVLARQVGLGRCYRCDRGCAPWDAYCQRHAPDPQTQDEETTA